MTDAKLVKENEGLRTIFTVKIDLYDELTAKYVAELCRKVKLKNMNCNWLNEIADIIEGK